MFTPWTELRRRPASSSSPPRRSTCAAESRWISTGGGDDAACAVRCSGDSTPPTCWPRPPPCLRSARRWSRWRRIWHRRPAPRGACSASVAVPASRWWWSITPTRRMPCKKCCRARELTGGALWCVFGCGGERDPGKRPLMGGIAAALADQVVVTSDNPRGEPPQAIMDQIISGMADQTPALVEADRRRAIQYAIARAAPGAVVVIAGKGHESHQEIAGRRWPFNDRAVAEAALRERAG